MKEGARLNCLFHAMAAQSKAAMQTVKLAIRTLRKWARRSFIFVSARRKPILACTFLVGFLSVLVITAELILTYSHYAALVDERLKEQALLLPPGIYAAPRHMTKGQKISRETVIQHLLNAGYLQGNQKTEFAPGNFVVNGNEIEVHTAEFARTESCPAVFRIGFQKDGVGSLKDLDGRTSWEQVTLPAEMLTADLASRWQTRRATSFNELPPALIHALCAIEDRRFFSHHGIDVIGILRAAVKNVSEGAIFEGASTITQQLVKNEFLTPEKTYRRKLAEAMMAMALERRLTKQQIMTLYCERVYLGHSGFITVYGFRQAAQVYFGKKLENLDVSEAAFLAGMVKAPNRYSPYAHSEEAIARRNLVLDAMVKAGYLTADAAAADQTERLVLLPPQKINDSAAPYFIDYVQREIGKIRVEEEEQPNLRIETTIDLDLQRAANQVVADHLSRINRSVSKQARKHGQPEAALVALDPQSGEILAMVGGRDYATSQLNRATDALRQPGSTFKPIVYATALSHGISPATTFLNAPHEITFGYNAVYRPQNFGRSYSNQPVTMREAIVRSLNIVTVDAAMQTGLGNVASMAERMGMPKPETYPSMALGAFEVTPLGLARAYTTFANNGIRTDPIAIRSVKQRGVETFSGEAAKAGVLAASTAYLVTDALADVVNRGTAARIRQMGYRGPAAGKTGTSRDAWFIGYTPKLLVVVWVGFDDNEDLGMTGGEAAVPIWVDFIKAALELRPDLAAKQFSRPSGLEEMEIDPDTGLLANEFCPHKQRMLLANYLAPGDCYQHQAPVELANTELPDPELFGSRSVEDLLFPAVQPLIKDKTDASKDAGLEKTGFDGKGEKTFNPLFPR